MNTNALKRDDMVLRRNMRKLDIAEQKAALVLRAALIEREWEPHTRSPMGRPSPSIELTTAKWQRVNGLRQGIGHSWPHIGPANSLVAEALWAWSPALHCRVFRAWSDALAKEGVPHTLNLVDPWSYEHLPPITMKAQ